MCRQTHPSLVDWLLLLVFLPPRGLIAFSSLVIPLVGPGMVTFPLLATAVTFVLVGELLSPSGEHEGVQDLYMATHRYLRPNLLH